MKATLLILFTMMSCMAMAQENKSGPTQHSFFAELGGPGILFSANFDTRFTKSSFGLGARAGLGFVSGFDLTYNNNNFGNDYRSVVTLPLQLNYIFGKENSVNALEIGAGLTITGKKINIFNYNSNDESSSVFGTASFMYRRMPKEGGFSWRAGFTPIISNGYIQPSAGISVGYNF